MNLMFVFLLLSSVYVESQCCSVTEVSTLLKGCKYLKGLSETSSGGTTINDDNCGLLVPVLEFLTEPLFQYPQADLNTFYTLFLLDPDVPLHSEGEFFVHMLKSNIPGSALAAKKNHTTGDVYIPFIPPTPPPALGPHRYISLLYEQANDSFRPDDVPVRRAKFVLGNWLEDKDLCGPVAATQFLTQTEPDTIV
ncbi:uncharacterized protein isoform X3 [Choristoneura fumiferana]|uniref:uncharacterized protein isoform X3 n=1 Tax=Choristoneura fumiferana TaxID=7141 RepID=UPI003D156E10